MMRSLFSAIAGLRNHQTFMDVVGNNIANVNTAGFKQSRVTFQDILSQSVRGASRPQGGRSGINPAQVGLGVLLAGVDTIQTQGTLQSTGRLTDLAIQGDGYFVLSDGTNELYSRDGAFDIGANGALVNPSNGMRVMGWQASADGKVEISSSLSELSIPIGQGMEGHASKSATITGNLNQGLDVADWASSNAAGGALSVSGKSTAPVGSYYNITVTSVSPSGAVTGLSWTRTNSDGTTVTGTAASNSFTDAGTTFSIAAAAGNTVNDIYATSAQASAVTLYDSVGEPHTVRTIFQKRPTTADPRNWGWSSYAFNAAGASVPAGNGALTFDTAGKMTGATTGTVTVSTDNTASSAGARGDLPVSFDFGKITQLAGNGDLVASTDGAGAGTLSSFQVGASGEVVGVYSNGLQKTLGQLAMAAFSNPGGLIKNGSNLFATSANTGEARIGTPGTNGRGQIAAGFLEMSNVDLAQQFTNMIMAERGFQANSRVITTSDEILQDLVNLKR